MRREAGGVFEFILLWTFFEEILWTQPFENIHFAPKHHPPQYTAPPARWGWTCVPPFSPWQPVSGWGANDMIKFFYLVRNPKKKHFRFSHLEHSALSHPEKSLYLLRLQMGNSTPHILYPIHGVEGEAKAVGCFLEWCLGNAVQKHTRGMHNESKAHISTEINVVDCNCT